MIHEIYHDYIGFFVKKNKKHGFGIKLFCRFYRYIGITYNSVDRFHCLFQCVTESCSIMRTFILFGNQMMLAIFLQTCSYKFSVHELHVGLHISLFSHKYLQASNTRLSKWDVILLLF